MKQILYLVMDVDGTLTDGKIYMSCDGEHVKVFNTRDGYGIKNILIPSGVIPIIITGRSSDILVRRCNEIGVNEIYQGCSDKLLQLKRIVDDLQTVAYIGDDLNDITCMKEIKKAGGVVGCPSDAVKKVKTISDYVSSYKGGEGAVRDFIDWIVEWN